ncbi:MAG TPA: glycosyl hydrolase family 65 protein [Acidimicrobiia bacterium]|nr:glycosyl hydrolase family 65 protein [Acidimicrobiia bacterium]
MSTWSLRYDSYRPEEEGLREALCALGNGVFATRGAGAESEAGEIHYPGTYAGGLFNRLTTEVSERVVENEDLVNLPNWLPFTFKVGAGPWFDIDSVEILDYTQELDIRRGVLTRLVDFEMEGRRTRLSQRRFVSMSDPRLAAMETTITPEGWSGTVTFRSALDGRVENRGVARYRQFASNHLESRGQGEVDGESIFVEVETSQSHIRIAEAARTQVFADDGLLTPERELVIEPGYAGHDLTVAVREGKPVRVEKLVTIVHSRQHAISEPGVDAREWVVRAPSFDEALQAHVLAWDTLWGRCRLEVGGSERAQQIINLHIFHLVQTVSPHSADLDVGVPARGLHGEAYRGHIFWDELFILPFLNHRLPQVAKALIMYRYRRLPAAKAAARAEGHQGAMYPWQSGSDGREESQIVHLNPKSGRWIPDNSRLQRHVGLAIAYNVWHHYQATGDIEFLAGRGAEMLVEIARFWSSIARYDPGMDRYRIEGVMGPDEYHDAYPDSEEPGLNDNAYTNVLTVWVLERAAAALELLPAARRGELKDRLLLSQDELALWEDITHRMRVCFHDDGIISQFDGYQDLEELDWEDYRARYGDIQRLDRILEAEEDTPNRYKVSKQADVLMLLYLLEAEELESILTGLGYEWDGQSIPRTIAYYLARTSHGSTLSWLVHSWVLARSDRLRSWELFTAALESDVGDIQGGTTPEGIHLGAMAGTVDLVQRCYSGLNVGSGALLLNPSVPAQLGAIEFPLLYRSRWLEVRLEGDHARVTAPLDGDDQVTAQIGDRVADLAPGETLEG